MHLGIEKRGFGYGNEVVPHMERVATKHTQ